MATKKQAAPSILDEVRAHTATRAGNWIRKLNDVDRQALDEVRRAIRSGELNESIYSVAAFLVKRFNLPCTKDAVYLWLKR